MAVNAYEVMEFHLSREVPNGGGFGLALAGCGWLVFSIVDESATAGLVLAGLFMLFLSALCFTFRIVVRMDNRKGEIEKTISTFIWKRYRKYAVAEFTGVGIGTARGSVAGGRVAPNTRHFVQLVGRPNVNIPGSSANKEMIIELAEQIGSYLNLPVDEKPNVPIVQRPMGW